MAGMEHAAGHPLPWIVTFPGGEDRRVRGEFVVAYLGPAHRWLPSSTHPTLEAAQAAAFPLQKGDGGTITREVFHARPAAGHSTTDQA